jgi:hypothetical protein
VQVREPPRGHEVVHPRPRLLPVRVHGTPRMKAAISSEASVAVCSNRVSRFR